MKTHSFTSRFRPRFFGAAHVACSLGALLPSCVDAEPRDLGFTQSSDDLSVGESGEPFVSPSNEFVGRWVGSAQEPLAFSDDGVTTPYQFPSGSPRIELALALDDESQLVGRIVFGAGEPPAPPVDPEAGYPVGVAYSALLGYEITDPVVGAINLHDVRSNLPPFEGFEYRVQLSGAIWVGESGYEVPDGVALLTFNAFEPIAPWCELQTPQRDPYGSYSCAPDLGGQYQSISDGTGASCEIESDTQHCNALLPDVPACEDDCDYTAFIACRDTATVAQVNCDQLFMCRSGFCECREGGCGAPSYAFNWLNVRRVGDELIGLFENVIFKNARGLNVPLGEVRLRLQP
jgi:hypothetical protein